MSEPLGVVCWKWKTPGYRSEFTAESVNVLQRMVARHYQRPHRFYCVTEKPDGLDPEVVFVKDRADFADVKSPMGGNNPSCYRRLRMFAPDAGDTFGPRFVSLDIDTVVTGDLAPLWDRPEDFVIWGDTNPTIPYNGSMVLMTAGARSKVWSEFDPVASPAKSKAAGFFGSDQGWIALALGPGEARWTQKDGVYSFRNDMLEGSRDLPKDARIVFWHGKYDPWTQWGMRFPWVRKHYR